MTTTSSEAPATSLEVRDRLVEALKLDLVGPSNDCELAEEQLPGWERPSNWYLTGFLIPSDTPPERSAAEDEDDDFNDVSETAGFTEESSEERKPAKKGFFPSSMGLSFLARPEAESVTVIVRWGEYVKAETEDDKGKPLPVWRRYPREESVTLPFSGSSDPLTYDVPNSEGLQLHVREDVIDAPEIAEHIPTGTRSVSIFLVNHREPNADQPDAAYVFQAEIEARGEPSFAPRPDLRSARGMDTDWDQRVADLHYRDTPEYATGHGVSAEWDLVNGECHVIRTAWIPTAQVEKTKTVDTEGVELSMDALGALEDGAAAEAALGRLVTRYREWIAAQADQLPPLNEKRQKTGEQLLRFADNAAERIERGIQILVSDPDALDAFCVANRAVARALRQRLGADTPPRWRTFQLAFILLNLPGLADPTHREREIVDLLFFPTGGGKTEAYLGLAAFAMVLRRLRHPEEEGRAGAGVSVIMRYTLRLLTLDQLGRAAGLVCALELEREKKARRYGEWPFEIGLWVGKAATPNFMGCKGDKRQDTARTKVTAYKGEPHSRPSPIPLENCPWCGEPFDGDSFSLHPNSDRPRELRVVCMNPECDFTGDRALPVVAVDEPLYRRLPAFLIATVDKFASLPFMARAGLLLGGAERYESDGFYGPADPGQGKPLPAPLPPPDLVIQDELHLIAGPLGTMAGLYETAIEALCMREMNGKRVRPKIVASTATVRRANDQIQALFARPQTQVFPPPGPNRKDSFFAETKPASETPAQLYAGVAAQGKNPKTMMRRVWLALMGAAQQAYWEAGGEDNIENPADPYMTVIGYFNALRELGGARRILEEEVQNALKTYGARRRIGENGRLFRDRTKFSEVMELTSRVPTNKVAEARRRLETPYSDRKQRVDCAIATNMISVGLDIARLGLMGVLGQPKTHAEYIQATSRVGRDDKRPGLVVTLLNIHKPRDRSHYEGFRHYHETFYRAVEAGSVTPFAARALDRGLPGAMVGLARHQCPELTPPQGVKRIAAVRSELERKLLEAFTERVRSQTMKEDERDERLRSVQDRIVDLLDSWVKVVQDYSEYGVEVQYQKYESTGPKPLLRDMLDTEFESEHHRKFKANRSLRDVEPEVNLFLETLTGGSKREDR